jgi:AraC-like DNA-binding protein
LKPQLHKLPVNPDASFIYKELIMDYFPMQWHFHKEFELVLIDKSTGTRFIGDNVSRFEDGDLCLIGPQVPHFYRNDDIFYHQKNIPSAQSIFIHFTEDFLGRDFLLIPEMKQVKTLLQRCCYVLEIQGTTKDQIINKLYAMRDETPPQRLVSLLEILIVLSESKELEQLLTFDFSARSNDKTQKVTQAIEFILKNFKQKIYVDTIAQQLNMSVPAFSRYFKTHTRKTFTDYVTEVRIAHACKLITENQFSISEIGYKSGFDNLSNFYRHFRKIHGLIPKEYRKRFLSNKIE